MLFVAPATLLKVAPPSLLTCHWTPGIGLAVAAAVKETEPPAQTLLFVGLAVTAGKVFTVIAALPETVPLQLTSETDVTV